MHSAMHLKMNRSLPMKTPSRPGHGRHCRAGAVGGDQLVAGMRPLTEQCQLRNQLLRLVVYGCFGRTLPLRPTMDVPAITFSTHPTTLCRRATALFQGRHNADRPHNSRISPIARRPRFARSCARRATHGVVRLDDVAVDSELGGDLRRYTTVRALLDAATAEATAGSSRGP